MKKYLKQYHSHKSHATARGIDFHFTYESWIEWWGEDINKRGRNSDCLVMARIGDIGPYHPDNVRKITQAENISEGQKGKIVSDETRYRMSAAHMGVSKSEETRRKMSVARMGVNAGVSKSEETREKMRAAQQKRRALEKQ